MKADDVLIITADHGCDPAFTATTDHTREYTPCLIYSGLIEGGNIGTRSTFADIGATVSALLGVPFVCDGECMINL
jgi:phosphopentomutase